MKMSKTVIVLAAVALIASGLAFATFQSGYFHRPRTVVFAPPYPEFNASGDPILADFGGRIPCHVANCEKLKIELVMYHNLQDGSSTAQQRAAGIRALTFASSCIGPLKRSHCARLSVYDLLISPRAHIAAMFSALDCRYI